jgi:CubicO group peptidase (beta-lactamase class C family)
MQALDKILAVENNLRKAIVVKGKPVDYFNLEERMQFYHVPGLSLAVIQDGEIEWARSYGIKEAGNPDSITPDTLFQAASISKPVAAMAALTLVEQGVLDLDEDVNQKLHTWKVPENEFTRAEKVTLRRLLSHSAGLTVHGFMGYSKGEAIPSIPQILDGIPPANSDAVRVDVAPGSIWRYSGGGTTVAQLLMMDSTGKPFAEWMQESVLERIGMTGSTYEQPLPEYLSGREARAHESDGKCYNGAWHTYPEQAAAGLWTTPIDLAKYVIEIQRSLRGGSNRVLDQQTVQEMLTIQKGKYGLGLHIEEDGAGTWFGHGGSNAGFRSQMIGLMNSGQGVVVMTNADLGTLLISEVIRSVASVYGWPVFQPREKECMTALPTSSKEITGVYALEEAPEVKLTIDGLDNHLYVDFPDLYPQEFTLYPQSETKYFIAEDGAELEFAFDDKPVTCQLYIEDTKLKLIKESTS